MDDPFMLERFLDAQNPVYCRVCAELQQGFKRSHWMWFIFPQIEGLGHSPMARKFEPGFPDQTTFPGYSSRGDTAKYNPAFQGRQMRSDAA